MISALGAMLTDFRRQRTARLLQPEIDCRDLVLFAAAERHEHLAGAAIIAILPRLTLRQPAP